MKEIPFSVVLLAGGTGTRMGSSIPKQYLKLFRKPIACYSFEVFASMPEVQEIVVVCDSKYESVFTTSLKNIEKRLIFATPGNRRQDSVFHGIQPLRNNPLVCIHDSARPIIEPSLIRQIVEEAQKWESAVVGVKAKSTIKVCDNDQMIVETPDRKTLWEIQTPQVIRLNVLKEGFFYANQHELTVTDDVSLVELIGKPVKIVEGSYSNIKVTTPDDLLIAKHLLKKYALL